MSNSQAEKKLEFGRDASEFLKSLEKCGAERQNTFKDSGIHIISLVSGEGGRVKVRVLVENRSGSEEIEFSLLCELVEKLELSVGEISGDTLSEIERCAEITEAFFSACASFAFAEGSKKALSRKLLKKGFSKEATLAAIEIVDARGFVNESEIAFSRMRAFLAKRWGRGRIIAKLFEEGFEGSAIDSVNDALDEIDFPSACAAVIERKYGDIPADKRERDKMCASLSRLGYSLAEIRSAIKIFSGQ